MHYVTCCTIACALTSNLGQQLDIACKCARQTWALDSGNNGKHSWRTTQQSQESCYACMIFHHRNKKADCNLIHGIFTTITHLTHKLESVRMIAIFL